MRISLLKQVRTVCGFGNAEIIDDGMHHLMVEEVTNKNQ